MASNNLRTTTRAGNVDSGTSVWLNADQVRRRAHLLVDEEKPKTKKFGDETRYLRKARDTLVFKKGEALAFDGSVSRAIEALFTGDGPPQGTAGSDADDAKKPREALKDPRVKAEAERADTAERRLAELKAKLTTLADRGKAVDAALAEATAAEEALGERASDEDKAKAAEAVNAAEKAAEAFDAELGGFLATFATPADNGGSN